MTPLQEACPVGSIVRVEAAWIGGLVGLVGPVVEHWNDLVGVRVSKTGAIRFFRDEGSLVVVDDTEPDPSAPGGDSVRQPQHYRSHPSGIECIEVTAHMNFTLGSAVKYLWRADLKHEDGGIEDLNKAKQYIDFEIARRTTGKPLDAIEDAA